MGVVERVFEGELRFTLFILCCVAILVELDDIHLDLA